MGGGLASGLAAYRLSQLRPSLRLLILERGTRLGGVHTWSFHQGDLPPRAFEWMKPLISRSWPEHEILFPSYRRKIRTAYHSLRSIDFHERVMAQIPDGVLFGIEVESVSPHEVKAVGGRVFQATAVIDGRGFSAEAASPCGYQKFLGLELELEGPHGLTGPILMDATCPQVDGFRFFYSLPFGPRTVLVEDTHYSESPFLDVETYRREIAAYAEAHGWKIGKVAYEEVGALPIPLRADMTEVEMARIGVPSIGVRGGLFHPTTGYSLPDAARLADHLATFPTLTSEGLIGFLSCYLREARKSRVFFRFLNRMLFLGAEPERRYQVLERFYRLSEPLVERFYAMRLGPLDCARLLMGKPPIPVGKALGCLFTMQ